MQKQYKHLGFLIDFNMSPIKESIDRITIIFVTWCLRGWTDPPKEYCADLLRAQ